jgi:acyl-CoA thioester hydrolase
VHETRIQTRWTDFDALGHLTHAAYPVYLDEGRDDLLLGTVGSFDAWPCVIVHVSIDYKREIPQPAREVIVRSRISEVGRTSVTFAQEVVAPDGSIAATATSVIVAWDVTARAARAITKDERALLA